MAPAVNRNLLAISLSTGRINLSTYFKTAGMIPAAPFVGAVTTRPPAAFSSFTASANMFIQSSVCIGSLENSVVSLRCNDGALRTTFNPPGKIPSASMPRFMQASMVIHSCWRRVLMSVSGCSAFSFFNINALMLKPCSLHKPSSSCAVRNG